jgi:iron complex transport system substrate-binding protein
VFHSIRLGVWAVFGSLAAACAPFAKSPASAPPSFTPPAQRIVSLDVCADQMVVGLVAPSRIAALSRDVDRDFSAVRGQAQGIARVRPRLEDVLAVRPDLVVRAYGGGSDIAGALERAGVRVVQMGFAQSLEDVRDEVLKAGDALGAAAAARERVAMLDRRRAALARPDLRPDQRPLALYVTPAGVTAGRGTLIDAMMREAGLQNIETASGWRPLGLERLATERPLIILAAYFSSQSGRSNHWGLARHPVVAAAFARAHTVHLDAAAVSCGSFAMWDGVAAMAEAARKAAPGA